MAELAAAASGRRFEPHANWREVLEPRERRPGAEAATTPAPAVIVPLRPAGGSRHRALARLARRAGVRGRRGPLGPRHGLALRDPVSACPAATESDETRLRALLDPGPAPRPARRPLPRQRRRRPALLGATATSCSEYYDFVMPDHDTARPPAHQGRAARDRRGARRPRAAHVPVESPRGGGGDRRRAPLPRDHQARLQPVVAEPRGQGDAAPEPPGRRAQGRPLRRRRASCSRPTDKIAAHDPRMIVEEIVPGEDSTPRCTTASTSTGTPDRWPPSPGRSSACCRSASARRPSCRAATTPSSSGSASTCCGAIRYQGLGGIEFKRDARDGRYKLIEFNARYGMWDSLGMRCGVDIPWAAYRDALGEPVEPQRSYRTGVSWVDLQRDARAFLRLPQPRASSASPAGSAPCWARRTGPSSTATTGGRPWCPWPSRRGRAGAVGSRLGRPGASTSGVRRD